VADVASVKRFVGTTGADAIVVRVGIDAVKVGADAVRAGIDAVRAGVDAVKVGADTVTMPIPEEGVRLTILSGTRGVDTVTIIPAVVAWDVVVPWIPGEDAVVFKDCALESII
jgi:hypothetical protein